MANPVNMEEKLELAKALNLKHQIRILEYKVSILEYKAGMFDLKFKQITFNDIRKRLRKIRFAPRITPSICASIMLILSSGFFFRSKAYAQTAYTWAIVLCDLLVIGMWVLDCIKINPVTFCLVNDFKYDIPYGAMLALKEAGECGITQHRIYFPTNDWRPLINHDPIITGIDKLGNMVEIYAWNENDIYKAK